MEGANDEQQLDIEFLRGLNTLKPYITSIMNKDHIELIKLWLVKLNEKDSMDKVVRNAYLISLKNQIQLGVLETPFSDPPPDGTLVDLQTYHTPGFETKSRSNTNNKLRKCTKNTTIESWKTEFANCLDKKATLLKERMELAAEDSSWMDLTEDGSGIMMASGDATRIKSSESCDNRPKMQELIYALQTLKAENRILNQEIAVLQRNGNGNGCTAEVSRLVNEVEALKFRLHELLDLRTDLQNSHSSVAAEWQNTVSSLHHKLTVMYRKNCELKNIINTLQSRLSDAQTLQMEVMSPEKCLLLSEMHQKELEMVKQKHEQELEQIQNSYNERLNEKSMEYNDKLEKMQSYFESKFQPANEDTVKYFNDGRGDLMFEQQSDDKLHQENRASIAELKDFYESRIAEIVQENERAMCAKNAEVDKLEKLLEEQCVRMEDEMQVIRSELVCNNASNEGEAEQIKFLQQCILKMDKLYKRAEREFNKQLSKMKQEMDLKEKHNLLLLTTQRVKLIASHSILKQRDIDDLVNNLEKHYKSILAEQQAEALKTKKNDLDTIDDLREQLALKSMRFD